MGNKKRMDIKGRAFFVTIRHLLEMKIRIPRSTYTDHAETYDAGKKLEMIWGVMLRNIEIPSRPGCLSI